MTEQQAIDLTNVLIEFVGGDTYWPCIVCKCLMHPIDNILGFWCSPECAEYEDRCIICKQGPSWCNCWETSDF